MASTIIIKNKNTGAPSSLAAGELAINTEDGGFYYGSTGGTSVSSSFKFGALTSSTFTNTGNVVIGGSVGATIYNSTTAATGYKLSGAKVIYIQSSPLEAATVFGKNNSTHTVISGSIISLGNPGDVNTHVTASGNISASGKIEGGNAFFDGNITSSGTISASGMIQTAGAISSSTGITASDAFFSGHVTASNLSIAGGISHTENTNTSIAFGDNRIDLTAGGTTGISVGPSGVASLTAGDALNIGAHAFTAKQLIANVADGTAPLIISSTTVVANLNADKLDGADLVDEDDMASNSATRIPTQQSVKAYVDKYRFTLFSHAFAVSRNTVVGNGNPMTDIFIQGNTIWGMADRAWVGQYGTGTGNILSGWDPTHIMNGITVPFDITNIRADVQLQSNKGATDNTVSGSLFLFKHPYTGSAVGNTTVNLIPIAMNSTVYTVNTETSYPVFSVSSSAELTGGNDNVVSASRGDIIIPMYRENGTHTGGHARGNFIITAEKV